jgi:Family of unknown function (DUF6169)
VQKMQKEGPLLSIYEYFFEGGLNNTYVFETNSNILYGVKFKPSEYIISDKSYSNSIYEMIIEVLDIPNEKRLYPDKIIPPTIAIIIKDFFLKIHQPILMYICDSSDNKQLVRHRKCLKNLRIHNLPRLNLFSLIIIKKDFQFPYF